MDRSERYSRSLAEIRSPTRDTGPPHTEIVAVQPVHGYAIAQRLQQISRDIVQVPGGSVYPALHRLENRSLVKSDWKETETGRDAKYYRLTNKGRAHLESQTASWRRLAGAVGLILDLAEEGAR